ncbi:insulinase family protein [Shewanella sp. 10N.261.52.F9]|uniref:insulinase family protein n=1 Tax=Shewanella sp. 10N.261.52.F9 TaxID=3229684 RepID=UPI00354E673D
MRLIAIKVAALALCSSLVLTAVGCQQTQVEFTATAEPQLPVFDVLAGAPEVTALQYRPLPAATQVTLANEQTSPLAIYLFNDTPSKLHHLSLVAYSVEPMTNLDVLVNAFSEKIHWLVQQTPLSCAESLRIRPTMHSLTLSIDCPDSPLIATELLMQFWQNDGLAEIDIAKVRRQLKLGKHINAYSGAEIDDVWAQKILGEQHIYNQALDDKTLADELDLAKLNKVRDSIFAQSQWAFFADKRLEQDVDLSANVIKQFSSITNVPRLSSTANSSSKNALSTQSSDRKTAFVEPSNTNKTLYLIDAPGSVQTQVRIGYPLSQPTDHNGDNDSKLDAIQNCKLLASWLGRSFSGRLYYDLREVRGLTYGIYGRCFDNPLSLTLKFYGSTKLEHTGAFIDGVLDHLALATETPISTTELGALTTYLTSQKILRQSNYRALELDTIKLLIRGDSSQQEQREASRLANLTPKQLQRIASSVFNNVPYIVIRGDADKISADINNKLPDWNIVEALAN